MGWIARADASHAWFSVFIPPLGWVDFDPTNDVRPGEGHVTLVWGRDYADVSPLSGVVTGGGDHVAEAGVDVVPVRANARCDFARARIPAYRNARTPINQRQNAESPLGVPRPVGPS